jgi:hypothetical protein
MKKSLKKSESICRAVKTYKNDLKLTIRKLLLSINVRLNQLSTIYTTKYRMHPNFVLPNRSLHQWKRVY